MKRYISDVMQIGKLPFFKTFKFNGCFVCLYLT